MESFLAFFEHMPIWMKASWVFIVLAFFWVIEGHYSFRSLTYNKWNHAKTNLGLLFFVMAINAVFGIVTVFIFEFTSAQGFGLLYWIPLPQWLGLLLSILVLDLIAQYGVHYLLHKVRWMWKLHLVHHSDLHVDASSGTRHHPLDFIIRETFAVFAVIIMGMPVAYYLLYRILSVLFTYFTHANLNLGKLDYALTYVFVSPNMHKFHHHDSLPWTDSNYGNMFSIWDRIFGTFAYGDPSKITYGLDILDPKTNQNTAQQLRLPFSYKKKS